jgi:hypothetical protein
VWVCTQLCKLQKGCTRLATTSDKVYQLLAHGRWFSQGTPASSTTKTGRHDIAEILMKVVLNTIKSKSLWILLYQPLVLVLTRKLIQNTYIHAEILPKTID